MPINVVKDQLDALQAGATLEQGYLGVSLAENAAANGVIIGAVEAGSGAAQAGLQAGDIITALNGTAVTDYGTMLDQISGKQPGDVVTVTIERDGVEQQVEVTLQPRNAEVTR